MGRCIVWSFVFRRLWAVLTPLRWFGPGSRWGEEIDLKKTGNPL